MKIILSLLTLTAVAGVVAFSFWPGRLAEPPRFRTQPVVRDDLLIAVSATGTVEPVEIIDVGAQIVGSVKSFGPDAGRPGKTIDYGSHVKQGDVLAQLDDLPHQAELDRARANLKLVEAEVKRFSVRRDQAERDVRRAEQLRETISVGEWEGSGRVRDRPSRSGDERGETGTGGDRRQASGDQSGLHHHPGAG
jgi:HlyD family secretion protein